MKRVSPHFAPRNSCAGSHAAGAQGAPETVLARCSHAVSNAGGPGRPFALTPALRAAVMQQVEELGGTLALRSLALACRSMPADQREVGHASPCSWQSRQLPQAAFSPSAGAGHLISVI